MSSYYWSGCCSLTPALDHKIKFASITYQILSIWGLTCRLYFTQVLCGVGNDTIRWRDLNITWRQRFGMAQAIPEHQRQCEMKILWNESKVWKRTPNSSSATCVLQIPLHILQHFTPYFQGLAHLRRYSKQDVTNSEEANKVLFHPGLSNLLWRNCSDWQLRAQLAA